MSIRKKLLVGTLGLAACGVAQAQDVTIYGTLFQFVENTKTSGATTPAPSNRPDQVGAGAYTGVNDPSRVRISSGTSNLGFRGSEDLGGGVKAIFQLESAWQIDGSPGPGWSGRNSHVGLTGKWGGLSVGQWDTPYKIISLAVNPIRVGYQADQTPVIGNPGFGVPATTTIASRVAGKGDAAFDRRQGNMIQYWSPTMSGLSARVQYSVDEGKTASSATASSISPTVLSAAVMYDIGGLSVRYAYEQHDDYFGMTQLGGSAGGSVANSSSKDRGQKLVAIWRFGSSRLAGIYERLEYKNSDSTASAMSNYKRNSYYVLGEQRFGTNNNNSLWAAYGRADDGSCGRVGGASCATNDLGADYVSAGYIHRLSKRTELIATYYKVTNKTSGTYAVQPPVGGPVAPGADTSAFGVGIAHFF
jgi:predicted porin